VKDDNVLYFYKRRNMRYKIFIFFIIFSFFLSSQLTGKEVIKKNKLTEKQNSLLIVANSLLGKKTYSKTIVNNKTFILDCIGLVSAVYYGIGIDIQKDFAKYSGNGVARLFSSLKDKNCIIKDKNPSIGDVIFWDNSWDKNGDGIMGNDQLTHAGIVINTDKDGTISYIHANYIYGIVIETMNLNEPTTFKDANGKTINSILALDATVKKHSLHWLSGDMWNAYGRVLNG
jgi:hypothetical protein